MKITDVITDFVGNPWKNWVFTRVNTDAGGLPEDKTLTPEQWAGPFVVYWEKF
jgi:hypothetical protein